MKFLSLLLSLEAKIVLRKRFSSFLWRIGAVAVIAAIDFAAENLGLFNLPMSLSIFLGLMLAELTKFIRTNLPAIRVARVVSMKAPVETPDETPPCAGCTDTK